MNLRTLTERYAITFREQLINLIYQLAWAILVKLGEINIDYYMEFSYHTHYQPEVMISARAQIDSRDDII